MKVTEKTEKVPVTTYEDKKTVVLEMNEQEANILYQLVSQTHGDCPETTDFYKNLQRFSDYRGNDKRFVKSRPGPYGGLGVWSVKDISYSRDSGETTYPSGYKHPGY